jgi:hypothetical protein
MLRFVFCTSAIVASAIVIAQSVHAQVVVTVNDSVSEPFSETAGYGVSYSPSDGIGNAPSGYTYWYNWVPSGNFGNTGYNVIQSHYILGQAPELTITISGLPNGSYPVYADVFTNTGLFPGYDPYPAYGSRLGLSSSSLTTYSHASGGQLLATGDSTPIVGQYEIREFLLGTAQATGGQLNVYLADFHGGGVTSTLAALRVVPEPSTLILAALGGLALLAWRCRR